ncbi:3-oxo-5a-steroid 4- dehydrogenase [Mortierella sp. AM989]|nr:3-oxo-5a-steroid 4- dehydrogenase [Mortierella sp. AM989]
MKLSVALKSQSLTILYFDGSPAEVKVESVQNAIAMQFPEYYPDRQRLTSEKTVLETGKSLADYGIKDGDSITFKDLGPQISWRTVFLIEYGGPLVIHPLIYYFPSLFYGQSFGHSWVQSVTYWMVMLHFLKREYETLFVHRFSHGTMPFRNLFKNSAHYHLLSGLNLAYWVYGPWNAEGTKLSERSDALVYGCIVLYVFAELSNYKTHVTLRNLRPPGTKIRKIPRGFGFDLVSCPNYFFETLSWLAVSVLTMSWSAHLFFVIAVGQMYLWAVKKHKGYRKEFPDYPRGRKAMFPLMA